MEIRAPGPGRAIRPVRRGHPADGGAMTGALRMAAIRPFHVMEILARARTLEAQGRDIVHMEIGEPDFPTPPRIIAAAERALRDGDVTYTPAAGLPELRLAIAGHYRDRHGLDLDPRRIFVTPGASGALLLALGILVNPGDAVAHADPGYPCYPNFIRLFDAVPEAIAVDGAEDFNLSAGLLAAPRDRHLAGLIVASPANPTGAILAPDALQALVSAMASEGGFVIADEIYQGLEYGVAAETALRCSDQVFVINSFSKYFGMTGWRLGWLVAPDAAVSELEKLAQNLYISAPSMAQHAALACFEPATIAIFEERRAEFGRRRDFLLPALRELGFNIAVEPEGAFYLYADISQFAGDAFAFCQHFLETEHVAFTPGLDFGRYQASHHVRFAYTQNLDRLQEAVERIARGLKSWQG